MPVIDLSKSHSIVNEYVSEIRDASIQQDRMRFRKNMERCGQVLAYEISKILPYKTKQVTTPLGTAEVEVLKNQPVIGAILRAGLILHQGMLNVFDHADNAFISAYRKHNIDGSFEIALEYLSCPELNERVFILADPMLATGSSLVKTIHFLKAEGRPKEIHIVAAIACTVGIEYIKRAEPYVTIWCGDIDEELTAKGYIVPGLGDAGDLAYGTKVQA